MPGEGAGGSQRLAQLQKGRTNFLLAGSLSSLEPKLRVGHLLLRGKEGSEKGVLELGPGITNLFKGNNELEFSDSLTLNYGVLRKLKEKKIIPD